MNLRGAGLAHHLDDFHRRRAAHDQIVDQHDPLARDDRAIGVVLEPDAEFADRLRRLDERAPDIMIADDSELEGNAAGLRVAERRRDAGIGNRHHDVGVGRRLARQFGAHRLARVIDRASVDDRIRPREIDVFENAGAHPLGGNGRKLCTPSREITTTSPFSTSRTNLAPIISSAQVSEARIQLPFSSPSTSGRMPSGSRAPISFLLVSATSA